MAMTAGVTGQFHEPWLSTAGVESCKDCHAPLFEQRGATADMTLAEEGVTCAACHVRNHVRFGPTPKGERIDEPPHNGFIEVKGFGDSRFCKPCHQFEVDGRRVNGKLLEDTYNQWKASEFSARGVGCADCHMPGRRHLFRGIHDKDTVLQGLTISVRHDQNSVELTVMNSGVGHSFPTYVTPQVSIGAILVSGDKKVELGKEWIGWFVPLDLSEEYFDTRIKPDESFTASFPLPDNATGSVDLVITVLPDNFYRRFFDYLIEYNVEGIDLTKIKEAHRNSVESAYILYSKTVEITAPGR